jgi:Sulfotransferase family
MIDVLEIQEKRKVYPLMVASPDDFSLGPMGSADPSVLVTDPTISLYCFDESTRQALFVQVPPEVDITAAAFMYIAQYDHAERMLAVPYEVLHRVAAGIELRAPLVWIHSTGRAGSTLMSKAFAEMEAVTSLSEPDVYTQAVRMRLAGSLDDELRDLLASATRLLFNPAFTRGSSLHVVKFRSFGIEVADLLSAAFPDAGSLFLYRDLGSYIRSAVRAFGTDDASPEDVRLMAGILATMTPLLNEELQQRPELDGVEVLCLSWLSAMQGYSRLRAGGISILGVRYEELSAEPRRVLEGVVEYLGLPMDRVENALKAFQHDSQLDSPLSRQEAATHTAEIDAHRWDLLRNVVRRYPVAGIDIPSASVALP